MNDNVDPELSRMVARVLPGARILRVERLGSDAAGAATQTSAKAAGYGVPTRIDISLGGKVQSLVLHGASENGFGHDRRADRAAELVLAADTFGTIPQHARVLEVGAFRVDGGTVPLTHTGEFYLLTEYVDGAPYAGDLRRIAQTKELLACDMDRVEALADYLVGLHAPVAGHPFAYRRSLRDLLGSGEGIFGIVDAYFQGTYDVDVRRLKAIEERCWQWRWALRARAPRLCRIHGDFHPFNVLFDQRGQLHVLDTSRGSLGDPADDVACMAVNFVFFAIDDPPAWRKALALLWRRFWQRYLAGSPDPQLLRTLAPFLAWRLLVLACPAWYPNQTVTARQRLFSFAEAALDADCFDPEMADAVFSSSR